MIQELLVNVKKHSEATLVFLKFKAGFKRLDILVKDNGKGCSPDNEKGKGLQNTVSRIADCGGTFNFETSPGNGTAVNFSLPI